MTDQPLRYEANGELHAVVVAEATFYLRAWDKQARAGLKVASERLFAVVSEHATYYLAGGSTRSKKFSRATCAAFLKAVEDGRRLASLTLESGATADSVGPWAFDANIDPDELDEDQSGSLRFTLPVAEAEKDWDSFRQLFIELATTLRAQSATGGYGVGYIRGLIDPAGRDEIIGGWAKRFRGLDVENAADTMGLSGTQVKGAGWTTFLNAEFVQELGGAEKIRSELPAAVQVIAIATGLVLVAGSRPKLGDVNRADDMSEYAAVARLLAPLRMKNSFPLPGLDREQTDAWFARFDSP